METLISVIMPIYNRADTCVSSIQSVLQQSYKNFELIIVDDGSSDDLRSAVNRFLCPTVRYYRVSKNCGQSYARNLGIYLAKGDVIAFQDSDDIWSADKLMLQLDAIQDADFSFCAFKRNGQFFPLYHPDCQQLYAMLLRMPAIGTPTLCCKKAVLNQVGGFRENYRCFEDYDLSLRLSKDYKGVFVDQVLLEAKDMPKHVGGEENANEAMRVRCDLLKRYYHDIRQFGLLESWLTGLEAFKPYCDPIIYQYESNRLNTFL